MKRVRCRLMSPRPPGRRILLLALCLSAPLPGRAAETPDPFLTPRHAAAIQERFQGASPCGCSVGDIHVDRALGTLSVECPSMTGSGEARSRFLEVRLRLRPRPGAPGPGETRNFQVEFRELPGFFGDLEQVRRCLAEWFVQRDGPLTEDLVTAITRDDGEPREEPVLVAPLLGGEVRRPVPEQDLTALWVPREEPGPMRLWLLGLALAVLLSVRLFWLRRWKEHRLAPRWGLLMICLVAFVLRLLLDGRLGDVRPVFLSSVGPDPGFPHRSSAVAAFQWTLSAALADWLGLPRWDLMVIGNRILGTWGVWNLGMLAFGLFQRRRIALLTAGVVALFPPHLWASVTSSDAPLVFLLLGYGLMDLVYAFRFRHFVSGGLGFASMAMATEVRVELLAYVAGSVALVWAAFPDRFRDRGLRRTFLAGIALSLPLMWPAFGKVWTVFRETDLAQPERLLDLGSLVQGWWRLAFHTPFVCTIWTLLFVHGLRVSRRWNRMYPVGVVVASGLSTAALVSGFMPAPQMLTDHRYYIPLLLLVAPAVAIGLDDVGDRLLSRALHPVSRLMALLCLLMILHFPAYPGLVPVSIETREFLYLREHLVVIPEGATVLIPRPASVADALEPGNWLSWLERRRIRWVKVSGDASEPMPSGSGPFYWYRGGQCLAVPENRVVPSEPCLAIERRFDRMQPVSLTLVEGQSLAGARYERLPVPLGLFEVRLRRETLDLGGLPAFPDR